MSLWTLKTLAEATSGQLQGEGKELITGISIDSRTLEPDDAFFAIVGDRFDGHDFVAAALKKNAAVCIVDETHSAQFPMQTPLIIVDDVMAALERTAMAARARTKAKIIAVTGSVGKTGTKEALRKTLSANGNTHASIASYNNHWGVPLSLARMPCETNFGVFEIGMNHPGEITPLAQMARPDIAIITTIAPVHLAHFENIEQIADAKAEIFSGLEPGGAAVLNCDNDQFDRLNQAAKTANISQIIRFGCNEKADARLLASTADGGSTVIEADILGERIHCRIGAPGQHIAENCVAVLAATKIAGGDIHVAASALASLSAPKGRGKRHTLNVGSGNATLIDESYNANPTSMRAALSLLGNTSLMNGGRRIAVLGDMLELGPLSAQMHRELSSSLFQNNVDQVYAVGPIMRELYETLPGSMQADWALASDELLDNILKDIRTNDIIMLKGSLGSRLGPIVDALLAAYQAQ